MTINLPVEVPDWVEYIAINRNGKIFGYSEMPFVDNAPGASHMWANPLKSTQYFIVDTRRRPFDFTKELYKITNGNLERMGSE